jgi:monomeric isocitrate dehydrogenase
LSLWEKRFSICLYSKQQVNRFDLNVLFFLLQVVGECLNDAVGKLLKGGKSPQRRCGTPDNRSSQYYIALYWAEALASKPGFESEFAPLYKQLVESESVIAAELASVQVSFIFRASSARPRRS